MTNRRDFWPDISHTISTWTLPGITCNGDEDRRNLSRFLQDHPAIERAIAKRIERGGNSPSAGDAPHDFPAGATPAPSGTPNPVSVEPTAPYVIAAQQRPAATAVTTAQPLGPTRISEAMAKYKSRQLSASVNNARTLQDKEYLFAQLAAFMFNGDPTLGEDPFLHQINARHLSDFIGAQAERPAKGTPLVSLRTGASLTNAGAVRMAVEGSPTLAPSTLSKKISDLRSLFKYALAELKAVVEDPTLGMVSLAKDYKRKSKKEDVHYSPFSDAQLRQIFEPRALLARSRDPDYFWSPLLGLFLGQRLGEIVNLSLSSVGLDAATSTWYIDITPEEAKNRNSVRRLPITQRLVDLGFIEYVEHLRELGATHLFPHRDMTTRTAVRDPSKGCSARFGEYLDSLGIVDRQYVFHSFRHGMVTALQDAGVPLSDSMQICGHEAQDLAIKTGRMTSEQARSVHLTVYTHADRSRMNVEYPLLRIKAALENAMAPPIDFLGLRIAADIVREHLVKRGAAFKSGWPPQRRNYTQAQVNRINAPAAVVTSAGSK